MIKKGYYALKRSFDIAASAAAFIVSLPIITVSAIVIFIDDPKGSPFFIQTRCGKDGKEFRMYKLRTMHLGAEEDLEDVLHMNEADGPVFKIKDDPRITPVGGFMRRTHIDELPQFLNVLKGDMSLVGPRPPLPREVAAYEDWHRQKLAVKQGLTCYWQISENRNDIPFDEWVRMDIRYIREQSVKTDIKILLATAKAVVRMTGA